MKIGIVCHPGFGGSGVVASELAMALAERGHQVHCISHRLPARLNDMQDGLFFHEVSVPDYPLFEYPPYEQALAGAIVAVAEREKLDLVHLHYAVPHAAAGLQAKAICKANGHDLPVITTLHGTDISVVGLDRHLWTVVRYALQSSDAVTAVSKRLRKNTQEFFSADTEIDVIYNFIDTDICANRGGGGLPTGIPKGDKVLCHASNFRPVKRVEDVVKVFHQVQQQVPASLVLVGDGPDRGAVEYRVRKLGIEGKVHFTGMVREPLRVVGDADIFLLPSETESFGLAALEAMACGLPVLSTNVGGLPELNVDGDSGYLSDVGDVDDMAANAIRMLTEPGLLETLSQGARERAELFDTRAIVPEYEALYQRVIGG